MNADGVRAAYAAVREEAGPAVTIVAATKYVALEDMAVLAAAGIPTKEDESGLQVRRCYVNDPFGNRIELVDARDAGFSLG